MSETSGKSGNGEHASEALPGVVASCPPSEDIPEGDRKERTAGENEEPGPQTSSPSPFLSNVGAEVTIPTFTSCFQPSVWPTRGHWPPVSQKKDRKDTQTLSTRSNLASESSQRKDLLNEASAFVKNLHQEP